MKKIIIGVLMLITALSACKKPDSFDAAKQLKIDEALIKDFIAANNIAAKRDTTGVYYVIGQPGTGRTINSLNTVLRLKYKGRLLNGVVFDQGEITQSLENLIEGWKIGVPLIKEGGKIRLLIPSQFAYGNSPIGTIPANSVLDFDVEFLGIIN